MRRAVYYIVVIFIIFLSFFFLLSEPYSMSAQLVGFFDFIKDLFGWSFSFFFRVGSFLIQFVYLIYCNWIISIISLSSSIFFYYLDWVYLVFMFVYFCIRYFFVMLLFYFVIFSATLAYFVIECSDIILDAGFSLVNISNLNFNTATGFGIEPVSLLNITPKGVSGEDLVPLGFISSIQVLIMWSVYFAYICFWFMLIVLNNLVSIIIWCFSTSVAFIIVVYSTIFKVIPAYFFYPYNMLHEYDVTIESFFIFLIIFSSFLIVFFFFFKIIIWKIQFLVFKFAKTSLFSFFISPRIISKLKFRPFNSDFYFLVKSMAVMVSQYMFSQPWRFETYVVFLSEIRIDPKVINFYVW